MALCKNSRKIVFWLALLSLAIARSLTQSGLLLDDGIVKPLPPVIRALLETKAALEHAGHTVIEFRM